jgi:hypothetical protein
MTAAAEVEVSCSAGEAWDLVSNVERIGEFSPECVQAWWVADRPARAVGGRFEGRNRKVDADGIREWIRPCDVLVWQPGRQFSWAVGDRYDGTPASLWTISIKPGSSGVVLSQEFRHVPDGLSGLRHWAEADPERAADEVAARTADLERGMATTLGRMKAALERDTPR